MKLIAALIAALTLVAPAYSAPNPEFSAPASQFAGKPVKVICADIASDGMAEPDTGKAWIKRWYCGPLELLLHGSYSYPARQGIGLITLAHELTHLRGTFNEAKTECIALQKVDDLARLFGVEAGYVPTLVRYAWNDHLDLISSNPAYRDRERCRRNGAWDLSPHDGVWP